MSTATQPGCSPIGLLADVGKPVWCATCGVETTFAHDHRDDNSGLDDGPPINPPRRKPAPKSPAEVAAIRAVAWTTRRRKYGGRGHR